jgi:hypothetical protein
MFETPISFANALVPFTASGNPLGPLTRKRGIAHPHQQGTPKPKKIIFRGAHNNSLGTPIWAPTTTTAAAAASAYLGTSIEELNVFAAVPVSDGSRHNVEPEGI